MQQTTIILNIYGGSVQDVFCTDPDAQVQVVDWDTDGLDLSDPGICEVTVERNRKRLVFVGGLLPNPLAHLAGTDVEQALQAAEVLDGIT